MSEESGRSGGALTEVPALRTTHPPGSLTHARDDQRCAIFNSRRITLSRKRTGSAPRRRSDYRAIFVCGIDSFGILMLSISRVFPIRTAPATRRSRSKSAGRSNVSGSTKAR
jgi:hypothetical protein